MDIDKTQILKSKLEKIKNGSEESGSEAIVDKYKGINTLGSWFMKSTLFWLTLNQLNAKFPNTYFVEFGYWETFLFTVSLTSFVSIFKSNKK